MEGSCWSSIIALRLSRSKNADADLRSAAVIDPLTCFILIVDLLLVSPALSYPPRPLVMGLGLPDSRSLPKRRKFSWEMGTVSWTEVEGSQEGQVASAKKCSDYHDLLEDGNVHRVPSPFAVLSWSLSYTVESKAYG